MVEPTTAAILAWAALAVLLAPFIMVGIIVITWMDVEVPPCAASARSTSRSSY